MYFFYVLKTFDREITTKKNVIFIKKKEKVMIEVEFFTGFTQIWLKTSGLSLDFIFIKKIGAGLEQNRLMTSFSIEKKRF